HGDLKVSTKELARQIGTKSVVPCSAEAALHHTGYVVGGISPFGTRKKVPVYMEETIVGLPRILINGGKRGYLVEVDPTDVVRVLQPTLVAVGTR
ncbi:MAG TPA: YbaK/EbsC family protein, partial [Dissulfurispiraceae bacterium]|nr:YbaK/EbsC family protein [Dissulfurispiraceae bacterium]